LIGRTYPATKMFVP